MGRSPVAIGGIGGSGTRLIASVLRDIGFFLGADLNEASDNLWFTLLFKRMELWPLEENKEEISRALAIFLNLMNRQPLATEDVIYVRQLTRQSRPKHPVEWLEDRVESIIDSGSTEAISTVDGRWGWKEPNTHILLPALLQEVDDLKYIHVMRHGVDMAFSRNQNQLEFWGELLLGRTVNLNDPVDSLDYWCAVHRRVLELTAEMGERFMMLNYDEFCQSPDRELPRLLAFLGVTTEEIQLEDVIGNNLMPRSLERHKQFDISIFPQSDLDYVKLLGFSI
jgi:hypothetical protein